MSDHHDHDHDHGHKPAPMVDEVSHFEILEMAVRELAIEKGLFTAEDHRTWVEYVHTLGPTPAARLVAKAWLDPEYKKLCEADGVEASKAVGVNWVTSPPTQFGTPSDYCNLRVLVDTPTVKHVVVCSLCSCYPRPILGQSPEWYRTPNYRRRLVRWPRQVLTEFGLQLPSEVTIRVADSNQKTRYIVDAGAARGHGRLDRGSADRDRDARLSDRRGCAQAWNYDKRQAPSAQGDPSSPTRPLMQM